MLRRAAPVLAPLLAQITLIGVGVRQVTGGRVVHDGLGHLADGGDHSMDEEEHEEETQAGNRLARTPPGINLSSGAFHPSNPHGVERRVR